MADGNSPLDTTIRIVTPENIAFHYRLAGPFRRLPAYLLDLLIQASLIIALYWALSTVVQSRASYGVGLVIAFSIYWGYGAFLETFWNGQTLGKKAAGIRVVSASGLPITGWQATLRNILRAADFALFFLNVAAISFLLTKRFQRIGDLAADTMVVVDEARRLRRVRDAEGAEVEELLTAIPASFVADAAMAEALASYVAKRDVLSPARRREVAGHLARPMIRGFGLAESVDPDALVRAAYRKVYL